MKQIGREELSDHELLTVARLLGDKEVLTLNPLTPQRGNLNPVSTEVENMPNR